MAQAARDAAWLVMMLILGACSLDVGAVPATLPSGVLLPTVDATPVATVTLPPPPTSTVTPTLAPTPTAVQNALTGPDDAQFYLRDAPGLLADVRATIGVGDVAQAVGRTSDGTWVQVALNDGSEGWLLAASVPALADDTLPTTAESLPTPEVAALVAPGDTVLLRALPSEGESAVNSEVDALGGLAVVGRTDDGAWVRVRTRDEDEGWVRAEALQLGVPVEALPVVPPAYLGAEGEIHARVRADAGGLRVRQLPNSGAPVLANLNAGTPLRVEGRTRDGVWVLVALPQGGNGYTAADFLDWYVPRESIATIDDPQVAS